MKWLTACLSPLFFRPDSSIQVDPVVEFKGLSDEEEAALDKAVDREEKKAAATVPRQTDFASLLEDAVVKVICQRQAKQNTPSKRSVHYYSHTELLHIQTHNMGWVSNFRTFLAVSRFIKSKKSATIEVQLCVWCWETCVLCYLRILVSRPLNILNFLSIWVFFPVFGVQHP